MSKYPRRSPLQAIRVFCTRCQGGSASGVTECTDSLCPFFPYREGLALSKGKHRPLKACKTYCTTNCLTDVSAKEIRDCGGDKAILGPCPIFPFRMGKNPNISDATKEKLRKAAIKHNTLRLNIQKTSPANTPIQPSKIAERLPL